MTTQATTDTTWIIEDAHGTEICSGSGDSLGDAEVIAGDKAKSAEGQVVYLWHPDFDDGESAEEIQA